MQSGKTPSTSSISADQFATLMDAMKMNIEGAIETKLHDFRKEIRLDHEETVEKVAKRARIEKPHVFKYKGNEDQFYFNEKIVDKIDEAGAKLEKAATDPLVSTAAGLSDTLEKAKEAVREGKTLMLQRQKHIKLVDRSDHGWKVVQEYEADDLANDSGDEKRIAKAEKSAEAKATANKKKLQRTTNSKAVNARAAGSNYPRYSQPLGQYQKSRAPGATTHGGQMAGQLIGPCHACHEMGHLRYQCPKVRNRQQYPLDVTCVNESVSSGLCTGSSCEEVVNWATIDEQGDVFTHRYWETEQ